MRSVAERLVLRTAAAAKRVVIDRLTQRKIALRERHCTRHAVPSIFRDNDPLLAAAVAEPFAVAHCVQRA